MFLINLNDFISNLSKYIENMIKILSAPSWNRTQVL